MFVNKKLNFSECCDVNSVNGVISKRLEKKCGFPEFCDVNSVNSVNSSKSLNNFEAYFKNKMYVLSTCQRRQQQRIGEKNMFFSEFFDVNSVNSSKFSNIFEAYFKNKISVLSTVSTASKEKN